MHLSRVPVPVHVHKAEVVNNFAPDFVEPSMGLVVVLDQVSVGPVTEGSICRVLAVAHLVVPTFAHVELNGSASSHVGIASAVTPGSVEGEPAGTPTVDLALLQIGVVREPA